MWRGLAFRPGPARQARWRAWRAGPCTQASGPCCRARRPEAARAHGAKKALKMSRVKERGGRDREGQKGQKTVDSGRRVAMFQGVKLALHCTARTVHACLHACLLAFPRTCLATLDTPAQWGRTCSRTTHKITCPPPPTSAPYHFTHLLTPPHPTPCPPPQTNQTNANTRIRYIEGAF